MTELLEKGPLNGTLQSKNDAQRAMNKIKSSSESSVIEKIDARLKEAYALNEAIRMPIQLLTH